MHFIEMAELTPLGHAVAGGISGMVGLTCTYPLDLIKTRLQVLCCRFRGRRG